MKFDYYAEYIYCIFISQISTKFCMFIFIDGIIKGNCLCGNLPRQPLLETKCVCQSGCSVMQSSFCTSSSSSLSSVVERRAVDAATDSQRCRIMKADFYSIISYMCVFVCTYCQERQCSTKGEEEGDVGWRASRRPKDTTSRTDGRRRRKETQDDGVQTPEDGRGRADVTDSAGRDVQAPGNAKEVVYVAHEAKKRRV